MNCFNCGDEGYIIDWDKWEWVERECATNPNFDESVWFTYEYDEINDKVLINGDPIC